MTKTSDVHLEGCRVLRVTGTGDWLTVAIGHDGQESFVADTLFRVPAKHLAEFVKALRNVA